MRCDVFSGSPRRMRRITFGQITCSLETVWILSKKTMRKGEDANEVILLSGAGPTLTPKVIPLFERLADECVLQEEM